ncbi:hypothetical protein AVEN_229141-1 [Araneus ventricosus]|uniref:Uncharacterized protein n=1 Tax=Araneus ventricosus TaxID=182803 RepID=A0A4Y2WVW4_ARAVE|nr:hypothetical protein AVEN_229141-1 [Araneus ventricosus]
MNKKLGDPKVVIAQKQPWKVQNSPTAKQLSDTSEVETSSPPSYTMATRAVLVAVQVWHMANCVMLLFFSFQHEGGLRYLDLLCFACSLLLSFG